MVQVSLSLVFLASFCSRRSQACSESFFLTVRRLFRYLLFLSRLRGPRGPVCSKLRFFLSLPLKHIVLPSFFLYLSPYVWQTLLRLPLSRPSYDCFLVKVTPWAQISLPLVSPLLKPPSPHVNPHSLCKPVPFRLPFFYHPPKVCSGQVTTSS